MRISKGDPSAAGPQLRIRSGSGTLTPLDEAVVHSPALAEAWATMIAGIRTTEVLDAREREMIVLRVAALNDATYQWGAHAERAEGVGITSPQLSALRNPGQLPAEHFGLRDMRLLEFVDASTSAVDVPHDVFERARTEFGDTGIVETAILTGAYNMISRVLVAIDLTEADRIAPLRAATDVGTR